MKLSDFVFDLPQELIAQYPAPNRESSRLMLVNRADRTVSHHRFADLPGLLQPNDLVVLNDTKVFPARIFARKKNGTARIEILLLQKIEDNYWEVLLRPARRVSSGTRLIFPGTDTEGVVESGSDPMKRRIRFKGGQNLMSWVEKNGQIPLPPYIQRKGNQYDTLDRQRYQTIFARETGSIAAPTAGLHFSTGILESIRHCEITLHVGYGTFKPIAVEQVENHVMDHEFFSISESTAKRIQRQLDQEQSVIAVGTTSTRTLEHVMAAQGEFSAISGWTDLFIYPGFKFRVISGLVTNFHLPGSTLILLVSAFADRELILEAYKIAIERRYRFYSYGDAMLII